MSMIGNGVTDFANPLSRMVRLTWTDFRHELTHLSRRSPQVTLIVGLASKNNTITYLTGISYNRLNFLAPHRWESVRALRVVAPDRVVGQAVRHRPSLLGFR